MENQDLRKKIIQTIADRKILSRGDLIQILQDEGFNNTDVAIVLNQLEKENKVHVIKAQPKFNQFIKSPRELWFLIIFLITTINIISWYLIPEEESNFLWIRYIIGTLFIFIVPGASVAYFLKLDKTIGSLEKFIIIVIMSIAIAPAVGLVLNFTPWGVDPIVLLVVLSLFSYLLSGASLIFRWKYYKEFESTIITSPLE
jgi:uncharacterized membrane protein